MSEPALFQIALGGVAAGGVYALIAAALALIHGKLRLIDVGHSIGLLLGVFGASFLLLNFGIDPLRALPLAAALGLAAGLLLPGAGRPWQGVAGERLMCGIALVVVAQYSVLQWSEAVPQQWSPAAGIDLLGFDFQPARALALCFGLLGCGLLAHVVDRTEFGRGVRALLSGRDVALVLPVATIRARSLGVALACLAAGACLLVPGNGIQVQAEGGFLPVVLALAVLGARGNFRDALSGGLLVGLTEAVARAVLGDERGLLCVAAVALVLLLGRGGQILRAGAYPASRFQRR
jgi:branched-chain amino acid transport system permease protein